MTLSATEIHGYWLSAASEESFLLVVLAGSFNCSETFTIKCFFSTCVMCLILSLPLKKEKKRESCLKKEKKKAFG